MLRQLATRNATKSVRAFSISRRAMVEGPSRTDSFKDRENAQEGAYIKKHEAEQLKKLKERLEEQKKVVDKLEKDLKNFKN
ncbi:hypothetical protein ACI3LY_002693 [Candidozyma auris]|uniref:ATPase inhibitor, mitochondrial n=1 Tax=Candidozyma auris TaxID=498019 RepID=A0A2H0ZME0_CANAR|nr:hypothetical_protein [[Candida] auris]PIS51786.1 hypothetical protein B9J08_003385 [[Candida] auris]PIS53774.1 hypothetical protein CJI97_003460 [[Candida] auris]PSK78995.1 hypothetical protein CJJ07_001078 [[Candida] auris]QEL58672.1 hypothetical protein CJJ09_000720 [[Candida] auris]QEO21087.1 hypothetical_protein [[Candida] auris]